ncbi:MAG: RluA family pseudouridine synthase [Verrucomicrobiae bacterium]|nr:RluA family pseudouridine synthase [Verrucomicrobiae bacterium]MDW7980163.1 RluA family pseudouridine synthase [Verrucomicrobiales bacterium]
MTNHAPDFLPLKLSWPGTREFWQIEVLFEDEHLLALYKPAGLLTSPDRFDPNRPNLMRLLHEAIAQGKPWAKQRGLTYLMNAHRLDFDTSGVLLLAKSKPVLVKLVELFGSEKPLKQYVALVHGRPSQDHFEVDAKLGPHPALPGVMRVDPARGKKSKTVFDVLEVFSGYTLLKCTPLTGRTHQIRVHLQYAGTPVVGDSTYGGAPLLLSRLKPDYKLKRGQTERPLINRTALHAERLDLPHPVTGERIIITAPWPKDLTVAVKYLRRFAK